VSEVLLDGLLQASVMERCPGDPLKREELTLRHNRSGLPFNSLPAEESHFAAFPNVPSVADADGRERLTYPATSPNSPRGRTCAVLSHTTGRQSALLAGRTGKQEKDERHIREPFLA